MSSKTQILVALFAIMVAMSCVSAAVLDVPAELSLHRVRRFSLTNTLFCLSFGGLVEMNKISEQITKECGTEDSFSYRLCVFRQLGSIGPDALQCFASS